MSDSRTDGVKPTRSSGSGRDGGRFEALKDFDPGHYSRGGGSSRLSSQDFRVAAEPPPLPPHHSYGYGGYRPGGFGAKRASALPRRPRSEDELFKSSVTSGINFDRYDEIPVEVSGSDCPEFMESFSVSGLHKRLMPNILLMKFDKPTPVQKHAIPIALDERDLMACAQTGSGKTAAFLLPVISMLLRNGPPDEPKVPADAFPVGLILSPTRELSAQIFEDSLRFTHKTGIRPVVVYGGADIREQIADLRKGCDVLVATPGRLVDLVERGVVSLACVRHLVIDEADRMLDMGFEPQIRQIVQECDMPPAGDRQTLMFSATFPKEIQRLASDFLHDYMFLTVGKVGSAIDLITQKVELVPDDEKDAQLVHMLRKIEGLVLVFVETKRRADILERYLQREGFSATSIHGDRSQVDREMALHNFKTGRMRVLVATDVAARGIDIAIEHVINYDLPTDVNDYVHRIGRTGRCGNCGTATSFYCDRNRGIVNDLCDILHEAGQEVPVWLQREVSYSFGGSRRGGSGFGGKDYRHGVAVHRGGRGGRGGRGRRGRGGRGGGGGGGYGGFRSASAGPGDGWGD